MDVSDFLRNPAQAGYMVAVVGARAPSFVHVADTSAAAREAAVTEAERLLRTFGRGRALVFRLEAVVDQMPAEFPPPTVKTCMPATIDLPLETVAKIGGEMGALKAEIASLRAAAETPKVHDHTVAVDLAKKPAQFIVREHGIYERRNGKIVGPARGRGDFVTRPWEISGNAYTTDGREDPYQGDRALPLDLIREIIVGEGWRPWNGGLVFAEADERVDIVTRQCAAGLGSVVRNCAAFALRWSHEGKPDDILAYRVSAPTTGVA